MKDDVLYKDTKYKNKNGNHLRGKTEFSQGVNMDAYIITEIKKD